MLMHTSRRNSVLAVGSRSPICNISPIGLIPKKNCPGRFCLIVDLSGSKCQWSLIGVPSNTPQSKRQLIEFPEALKSAYRMIPIHPDDTGHLVARQIVALPFKLHSAPIVFSAVACLGDGHSSTSALSSSLSSSSGIAARCHASATRHSRR